MASPALCDGLHDRVPASRAFIVTQPVAKSAIVRLREVATVKVNPDASRIIGQAAR